MNCGELLLSGRCLATGFDGLVFKPGDDLQHKHSFDHVNSAVLWVTNSENTQLTARLGSKHCPSHEPLPVAAIALASTFMLGFLIEWIGTLLHISKDKLTSLCLLGTLKNYGLAAGLALSLFSKESALPAAVFMIIMMIYIAWLDFKMRWA